MSQIQAKPSAHSGIWSVHSERDNKPMLRGFSKTETSANDLLKTLRAEDNDADETEYWVLELTENEVADFSNAGMLDVKSL